MQKRRQPHGPKLREGNSSEMPLFMPAKYAAQNFFRQPAIQQSQLLYVVHVFQVVVQNRHIPDALFNRISSNVDQLLSAPPRFFFSLPAPFPTKRKSEQILHLV